MNRRLLLSIGSVIGISGTAVGGVFLDKHIKENMFLYRADEGAERLEKANTGIWFARSSHPDELWKLMWIFEVRKFYGDIQFTKEDKLAKEKSYWNQLLNQNKIPTSKKEKLEIEKRYKNYWERLKYSCLQFQANEASIGASINDNICTITEDLKDPKKYKEEFFWYEEFKKSSLDINEFFWTKAYKFRNTSEYVSNNTEENKKRFSNWLKNQTESNP